MTTSTAALMTEMTIEQCCEGRIEFRKLTMAERDAVVTIMMQRGYRSRAIATRCHGTVGIVQDAITRVGKQQETHRDQVA